MKLIFVLSILLACAACHDSLPALPDPSFDLEWVGENYELKISPNAVVRRIFKISIANSSGENLMNKMENSKGNSSYEEEPLIRLASKPRPGEIITVTCYLKFETWMAVRFTTVTKTIKAP